MKTNYYKALAFALLPVATYKVLSLSLYDTLSIMNVNALNFVLVLAFSPLFFSIPSLLLQNDRDNYMRETNSFGELLLRTATIAPAMIFKNGDRGLIHLGSYIGFFALLFVI